MDEHLFLDRFMRHYQNALVYVLEGKLLVFFFLIFHFPLFSFQKMKKKKKHTHTHTTCKTTTEPPVNQKNEGPLSDFSFLGLISPTETEGKW